MKKWIALTAIGTIEAYFTTLKKCAKKQPKKDNKTWGRSKKRTSTYVVFVCLNFRKIIEIPIMEEDSYEKNAVLYCTIGEPIHLAGKFIPPTHFKTSNEMTFRWIISNVDNST